MEAKRKSLPIFYFKINSVLCGLKDYLASTNLNFMKLTSVDKGIALLIKMKHLTFLILKNFQLFICYITT
jgi:hypothetical protein